MVAYDRATSATVRGAGHLVPSYQIVLALMIISAFLKRNVPPSLRVILLVPPGLSHNPMTWTSRVNLASASFSKCLLLLHNTSSMGTRRTRLFATTRCHFITMLPRIYRCCLCMRDMTGMFLSFIPLYLL